MWQAPQGTSSTNSQYLYCDSSHPHQLTGLYSLGATCSTKTGQTYASSYDAWGNVTSRNVNGTTATLSYDGLDHLTKYDAGSNGQEQYVYDASGERVLRRSTSAGNTTMTIYAFGLEEHLYSGSGVNQGNTYYYSLGGMPIGEFDGTNINMFLTDALGSVIETISAAANSASVQGNQVYSPYGSSRYQQGSMGTTKGFTGQYNDSVTGLDYYGARYYDPVVGRFLSADALEGNGAGMDPYAYVGGNPETFSDPSGQFYAPPPGGGGGPLPDGGNGGQHNQTGFAPPPPSVDSPPEVNPLDLPFFRVVVPTAAAEGGVAFGVAAAVVVGAVFLIAISVAIMVAPSRPNGPQYPANSPQPVPAPTPTTTQAPTTTTASDTGAITLSLQPQTSPGGSGKPPSTGRPPVAPGAPCSFTPDTQVSTDHGKEDIGKLHVGDKVLAYNPKTHKMEWQPILHVWKHTDHDLIDLTITTAAKGQRGMSATKTNEVVHTTSEHPFFATEQGFVPAGKVHVGLHVLRADGSMGVITGWKVAPGTQVMYNLEVANDHTFTVGVGQWVVHNRCDRTKLRANLGLLTGDPRVAQHVIPCELENDPLVVLSGLDINSATNGRIVYTDTAAAQGNDEIYHSGSHASYTSYVQFLLTRRRAELTAAGNLTQPSAMKKILDTIRDANANIAGLNIEAANSSIPLRLC